MHEGLGLEANKQTDADEAGRRWDTCYRTRRMVVIVGVGVWGWVKGKEGSEASGDGVREVLMPDDGWPRGIVVTLVVWLRGVLDGHVSNSGL